MPPHVLVAYGSKNGATAEIARWIGDTLAAAGCEAVVKSAAQVRSPEGYDAVVLGGALYTGRWHRDAARFARRHVRELSQKPLWLFSSGPLDRTAGERDIPAVPQVRRAAHRLGAREHVTFGGRLGEEAKGLLAQRIVRSGRGGDFRDPELVRAWANGVGQELVKEVGAESGAAPRSGLG